MAAPILYNTVYWPGSPGTVDINVNLSIDGNPAPTLLTCTASELKLSAIAAADSPPRTEWNTDDCRTLAQTAMGLSTIG
jgi:hypothetical protein